VENRTLSDLLTSNEQWAKRMEANHPGFFIGLSKQQAPEYLWIGCSDSRVPANEIVGLAPGELFVHRNVANVVSHTDFNVLSVLQYAVEVLHIKHIIVCGHYGCGGVRAALSNQKYGLIDNWLRGIKDIYDKHHAVIDAGVDEEKRVNLLCEYNVKRQVKHVCYTTIVQNAWLRGQELAVHGWIYDIHDGLIQDLNVTIDSVEQISDIYQYEK
jgi:carbonic anhydrase